MVREPEVDHTQLFWYSQEGHRAEQCFWDKKNDGEQGWVARRNQTFLSWHRLTSSHCIVLQLDTWWHQGTASLISQYTGALRTSKCQRDTWWPEGHLWMTFSEYYWYPSLIHDDPRALTVHFPSILVSSGYQSDSMIHDDFRVPLVRYFIILVSAGHLCLLDSWWLEDTAGSLSQYAVVLRPQTSVLRA